MPTSSDTVPARYRGRFAPSPTGPLHFGSLVAAVGSFLQARAQNGEWLLRIDDLDAPREAPGAADDILRTLERLGLTWDGAVVTQRARLAEYEDAIERLRDGDLLYACACSRREIADSSAAGIDGPVYPGTCRAGVAGGRSGRALRVRTDNATITFDDRWQGRIDCALERFVGDFVVRRADGIVAYQLAAAVDDAAQGITEVVRGADLLWSTPRQVYLQRLLGIPSPAYAHLPVALNARGEKLSKQTGAPSIAGQARLPLLRWVLAFLGQEPLPDTVPGDADSDLDAFWRAAIARWRPERVPRTAPFDVRIFSDR